MPNRWERNADNVLVPKIPSEGIDKEDIKVLPAYSKTDDFNYTVDAQVDVVYDLQVGDTLSYPAAGTKDASGTTAGNTAGFVTTGAANTVDPTKKLTFKWRVQLLDADTELFAYIGCAQTVPTAADPPVEADDFIGFTLVEGTANANWFAHVATNLGTDETEEDTGKVVDLLVHDYEFTLENSVATFKIDGDVVSTITTDLPTNTALIPLIQVTTGDTAIKSILADVLQITNAR